MKNRIREIMQVQGMTIQNLANMSDVSRRTVQNIVNGMDSCHMETMVKLAEALGVSLAELFLEPYERIVRYAEAEERSNKAVLGNVEFAEEHGAYSVPAELINRPDKPLRRDNSISSDGDTVRKLASAAYECFRYLPPEVQREFFELCHNNGRRKSKEIK